MKESKALNSTEAFPVIARYFKSGLRPHEFYKKVGWSDNQFSYWKKRYMSDHNMVEQADEPTSQFHPIDVVSTPISKGEEPTGRIELEYPNGVILRITSRLSDARIASLVKLY